ncbi:MAG TPA: DNA polymerase I [Clostridiales bacterium]|nr:DNA polymerase I [Clostridiales bacterium]
MNKILLLDCHSLINRAFYAIREMRTIDGFPTNAIYGFFRMLSNIIETQKPTHIGAVFDMKGPTFRNDIYSEYKSNRKPTPEELIQQVEEIKSILESLNIKVIGKSGYEADDVIGTIAKFSSDEVIIVSGDRDLYQLVDSKTNVLFTKKGVSDLENINEQFLFDKGLTAQKVIEYKALAGDSADNIPGAKGIGKKTAEKLLAEFDTVEEIYSNLNGANVSENIKEKLIESKDIVLISKKLATIDINVPIEINLDDFVFHKSITDEFIEKMTNLEIISLIERYKEILDTSKLSIPISHDIEINDIDELINLLSTVSWEISFYLTDDIHFSIDDKAYHVKTQQTLLDDGINFDNAIKAFKKVFEDVEIKKILFDAKDLMHKLETYNISINGNFDDTLLKQYLINSNRIPKDIESLFAIYKVNNGTGLDLKNINIEQDAILKDKGLWNLYTNFELPLINILFEMENTGFRVDLDALNALGLEYLSVLNDLSDQIYEIAGKTFNINSNQQLGEVLFEDLNLQHGKKTKTGYSVSAETLESLDHPIIPIILKYRKYMKLNSTYIQGMRSQVNQNTMRIHTIFNQCVTVTGRLSSTEPNMQNIPIKTEEGREIRKVLIPKDDCVLISADYSQIELRLLAHFSQDENMIKLFEENIDIHAGTASKIYKIPLNAITDNMRRNAKAVNFGIIYGISNFGLAKTIGIPQYQAKAFIETYFDTFKRIKPYMDSNVKFAKDNGYIRSLSGRIRYFDEFKSTNKNLHNFASRAAMNMPLQGSAADIIKLAMIKVNNELKNNSCKAKLILQVHDELILECPNEEIEFVSSLLKTNMENVIKLKVPLIVDVKIGKNWFELM